MNEVLLPLLSFGRVDNVLFRAGSGFAPSDLSVEEIRQKLREHKEAGASSVVFPSHFFEHAERAEIFRAAGESGLARWIQISPGAELMEFYPLIGAFLSQALDGLWGFGLEVIFDREIYARDLEKLEEFVQRGGAIRFVFCPSREITTLQALSTLPQWVLSSMSFYFPPKTRVDDSFLGPDEIFLLVHELRKEFREKPALTLAVAAHFKGHEPPESERTEDYRFSLDEAFYREHFSNLGAAGHWRSIARFFASHSVLRLPVVALYYLLFALRSPIEMFSDVLNHCRAAWGRLRVGGIQAFWKSRHTVLQTSSGAYWGSRKGLGFARVLSIRAYWEGRQEIGKARVGGIRALWKGRHIALWATAAAYWVGRRGLGQARVGGIRVFWKTRHVALMMATAAYWGIRRSLGQARVLAIHTYWGCYHVVEWFYFRLKVMSIRVYWRIYHWSYQFYRMLRGIFAPLFTSPIWFFKKWLPPAYWILIFPFQKCFWFCEYQLKKRVFKGFKGEELESS